MDNCKFSHLADERRADLERIVKEKQKVREDKTRALEDRDPEKTLSEWLLKRSKTDDQNVNEVNIVSEAPLLPGYEIPPHVAQLQNPPPSVLPPPTDVLRGLSFVDWGWVSLWELCSFQWNSKFSVCCKMILVSLFLCVQKKTQIRGTSTIILDVVIYLQCLFSSIPVYIIWNSLSVNLSVLKLWYTCISSVISWTVYHYSCHV